MGTLKNALTALFNSNNYTPSTSGIASKKIPVTETSGLPTGQISISNLALVLESTDYITVSSGSLNTCNEVGRKYWVANSATVDDRPITNQSLLVFVIGTSGIRYQIAFNALGGKVYMRSNNNVDHTLWNTWYEFSLTAMT